MAGPAGWFGYLGAVLSGSGAAFIIANLGWGGFYSSIVIACIIAIVLISMTWSRESAGTDGEKKPVAEKAGEVSGDGEDAGKD